MRIALYHYMTSGGSKREAYELAREIKAHGHRIDVYQPRFHEHFLPLGDVVDETIRLDLSLISNASLRAPGLSRYIGFAIWWANLQRLKHMARKAATLIDQGGYDLVFAHYDHPIQSPYILRHTRTASAYYCAEPMRAFYEPSITRTYQKARSRFDAVQRVWYTPERWLRNWITRRDDRRNAGHATRLLTSSYFSAESIYRAYGLRARVSYLGVDTNRFRPLNSERQNMVLAVGAIAPVKGHDFVIEALGKLPANKRPVLVIVADRQVTGEQDYLRRLAAQCGVVVRFCLNISDVALIRLYNESRVFVYASVMEPFGLAPVEAMACGTPVVAVKEGGVRESVTDGVTGLLTPRDMDAFATAVNRVLTAPGLGEQLGCSGRAEVERMWTWRLAYERFAENIAGLA